ncbi:MBOAT family O-acyltransferase [Fimbriiglobus ruber]|uniref:Alginate O-acetyltransferase n=1 Tax=Fimbriiglobus ruber TaxID=1908690 RepID=A0A225DWV8_9BACT|nr:MBOAT family O-acyltransferase [Fimbriiglobus ruber]OWK42968.1 alginate O-acetyltransferase [Fimbriiglobus ruber]
MPLFAQAAPLPVLPPNPAVLNAEQLQAATDTVHAVPANQLATADPKWFSQAAQILERNRWENEEGSYFRELHKLLPELFFQTQGFVLFFLAVATIYWLMPRRWNTVRVWVLVIASFHFYAAWNASLAFLVTGTATLDYFFARAIEWTANRRTKFAIMWTSIGMNLGILCYFKYRGFFLNELHDGLVRLGAHPAFDRFTPLDILIPFGISFYTFEAVSYAVDVYKSKVRAERSLPHFLLFILFFPHLVAGPIVRAGDFLKQAHRVKRWNWVRIQIGVQFVLLGLFKKLAIADRMAVFCDGVPGNPGPLLDPASYNASALWLAVLAYALRIYADFSGYSDMAVGTAHLLGYRLTQNFNMPYLSPNVGEFWRRWHISLSSWLRDYLYIPLGGSRGSAFATNRNLMITMILGGLWHGANWPYLIWGAIHGGLLVGHRQFRAFAENRPTLRAVLESTPGTVARVALTFFCVSLCWVFFRPDLDKALITLERMFTLAQSGQSLALHNRSLWWTVAFVFGCHLLVAHGIWQWLWARTPPVFVGFGYAVTLTVAMVLAPEQGQTFIYFTF